MDDFDFNNYTWHSTTELDEHSLFNKKINKLKASDDNVMQSFSRFKPESKLLIHKATKALWKFSDDGEYIEPVFAEDILTSKDLEK